MLYPYFSKSLELSSKRTAPGNHCRSCLVVGRCRSLRSSKPGKDGLTKTRLWFIWRACIASWSSPKQFSIHDWNISNFSQSTWIGQVQSHISVNHPTCWHWMVRKHQSSSSTVLNPGNVWSRIHDPQFSTPTPERPLFFPSLLGKTIWRARNRGSNLIR